MIQHRSQTIIVCVGTLPEVTADMDPLILQGYRFSGLRPDEQAPRVTGETQWIGLVVADPISMQALGMAQAGMDAMMRLGEDKPVDGDEWKRS